MLNAKEIDEDNLSHVDKGCLMLRKYASQRCFQARSNVGAYAKNFLQFVTESF